MNPINVTGYDRDERAAWAADRGMNNGPTTTVFYCITASYSDGLGAPDVSLVTDNEMLARNYLELIERVEPMKVVRMVTPIAVVLKSTNAQEGIEK